VKGFSSFLRMWCRSNKLMKLTSTVAIRLKTGLRAGTVTGGRETPPAGLNHNQRGLAVKTKLRFGLGGERPPPSGLNHNQRGLA
jgi:hypothetical protein